LSKLLDQLKDATRTREEKSPGILLEALQRSQTRDPNTAAETAPVPAPAPAGAPSPAAPAPNSVAPEPAGAQSSPYAGIVLAAAILAGAWLAWNAAPWSAPQKVRIDASTLKLDRSFQIDRPSAKGTTPPAPRS
jgi:hypothetical protein